MATKNKKHSTRTSFAAKYARDNKLKLTAERTKKAQN
jgi:hypothetical protein